MPTYEERAQSVADRLVGARIVAVEPMPISELNVRGWSPMSSAVPLRIKLDDGSLLIPCCDPEGNAPGYLEIHSSYPAVQKWREREAARRQAAPDEASDRDTTPTADAFGENARGLRAREKWARQYYERDGAPDGDSDR